MIYVSLFITFFQIGLFSFGGGYGMLSVIQSEVVHHHHWITSGQFSDIVAISQMTPGPIGINSATYCGYEALFATGAPQWACVLGSLVATVALVLPSLLLVLAISRFFMRYNGNPHVQTVMNVLKPVVLGLLGAAFLMMLNTDNFSSPHTDMWRFSISCFLFLVAFFGVKKLHISPIRMLFYCGVAGGLLFY